MDPSPGPWALKPLVAANTPPHPLPLLWRRAWRPPLIRELLPLFAPPGARARRVLSPGLTVAKEASLPARVPQPQDFLRGARSPSHHSADVPSP